jgi:hypothetical protein
MSQSQKGKKEGQAGKGKKTAKPGAETKTDDVLQAVVSVARSWARGAERSELTVIAKDHCRLFSGQIQTVFAREAKSMSQLPRAPPVSHD